MGHPVGLSTERACASRMLGEGCQTPPKGRSTRATELLWVAPCVLREARKKALGGTSVPNSTEQRWP